MPADPGVMWAADGELVERMRQRPTHVGDPGTVTNPAPVRYRICEADDAHGRALRGLARRGRCDGEGRVEYLPSRA